MADYTVVANDILQTSGEYGFGIAGAALAAGDALYEDSADNRELKLADANGAGDIHIFKGLALHAAAVGQPIKYAKNGTVVLTTGSAVGAIGATVVLSATAGKLAPAGDIANGHFTNVLGFLDSTGKILHLSPIRSAVAQA